MPATPSPDWLVERGIGEKRFVRIADGCIVEARVFLDGTVAAGWVRDARLTSVGFSRRNGIAAVGKQEFLLPNVPNEVTEGTRLKIEITREAIPGSEPWKRPIARVVKLGHHPDRYPESRTLPFPDPKDELEEAGWSDLLEEARSGIVAFTGGVLRISPTPAMTLIDVDGAMPAFELAMAGAKAAARAIRRHAIGGSIGIDLPTVQGKDQRVAIGAAVDTILPNPFERTAVNGFGFLQIVRRRAFASLFELALDRPAFEARTLLRLAARETGNIQLAVHPAVQAVLQANPDWLAALARQVGGTIGLRADPRLTMSGGHAEKA